MTEPSKRCANGEPCAYLKAALCKTGTRGLFFDSPINLKTGEPSDITFLVHGAAGRGNKFTLCRYCPFCGGVWGPQTSENDPEAEARRLKEEVWRLQAALDKACSALETLSSDSHAVAKAASGVMESAGRAAREAYVAVNGLQNQTKAGT